MPKTLKNQKIKRTQKIKYVNAPKQPMNAYFFFLKDKRSDFKATHPDLKSTEIVKSLNKQWIELDITEKEKYQALANADKERYLLAKTSKK
ncbi:hypothetical protein [Spiroplasma ixodetis]|uniref:HMG box domain-containing protein n=1 Tax=Spiroplasma ixodetis TaxID=2141 RepID=A0ABM8BXF1_9MOLU|nr:hypothetical protein [Spiroplasma ixodetis]BDT04553.1 hypothetical protein SHM_21990 [Spiroplasma ixodetis]